MNPPFDASSLMKASDFATSFIDKLTDNIPLLISLFFTFGAISLTPSGFFPVYFHDFKWIFPYLTLFLGCYTILVYYYSYRRYFQGRSHLKHLGTDEKALLRAYLEEDVSCKMLSPIMNGRAASLIGKGILTIASSTFSALSAPIVLDPSYQVYLRKHPEIVGLKKEDIGSKTINDSESSYGCE
jgi:hypothetical protein